MCNCEMYVSVSSDQGTAEAKKPLMDQEVQSGSPLK